MRDLKIWAGLGYRAGGRIVVGMERTAGVIYSLSDPLHSVRAAFLVSDAVSVGLALGGGISPRVILAWGYDTSDQMQDVAIGSVDIALDLGLKGTGQYLKSLWEVGKTGRWAKHAGTVAQFAENYSKSKDIAIDLATNIGTNLSRPGLVILGVPGVGLGFEVALALKAQDVSVTQSMLLNTTDRWAVELHATHVLGALIGV